MAKHHWTLTARDRHISRYACACGMVKTVVTDDDRFPVTRYKTRQGNQIERAGECTVVGDCELNKRGE